MDVLAVTIERGALRSFLDDQAPQPETVAQLRRRLLDGVDLGQRHRLGGVQEKVVEALQNGFERIWLLPDVELHRVAGDQPGMLQLLEDAQLVTRLHASQEYDRDSALVGSQDRAEPPICALIGSLVSRRAGLVVVLGKPSVGGQLRGDDATTVS